MNHIPEKQSEARNALQKEKARSLSDSAVLRVVMKGNVEAAKAILVPILNRDDFEVESVDTEQRYQMFGAHAVCFDCVIRFRDGTICDLEVQKAKKGMTLDRILFYASMLRVSFLPEGAPYEGTRKTIVIFIYDGDFFGEGDPLYVLGWSKKGSPNFIDVKQSVYIVNMKNQDLSTALGRLMHDLTCTTSAEVQDSALAKTLSMVESKQGETKVNEKLLDIFDQAKEEGREEGRAEGREEGRAEGREEGRAEGREEGRIEGLEEGLAKGQTRTLLNLVRDGSLPLSVAARNLGVSEEEFRRLLAEE